MKKYLKFLFIGLLLSCNEETVVDEVFDTTTSGAVLRTIDVSSALSIDDLQNATFSVTLEEQDAQNGGLLERVDVYVDFVDRSASNGTTTTDETLLETITASAFSTNEIGLPQTTFTTTGAELTNALGLVDGDIFGGDQFEIRFDLLLTDGRSFSASQASGNISGGAYFSSPYVYFATLVCGGEIEDPPGTYTIDMQDSFGDGWNGAAISANIDGTSIDIVLDDFTTDGGSTATYDLVVPAGTSTLTFDYVSGDFDSEVTFQITAPWGFVIADVGPSPAEGPISLNVCR